MGFHKSSMNIELKEGHILTAYCARPSGEAHYSEMDLNEFLGIRKGKKAVIRDLSCLVLALSIASVTIALQSAWSGCDWQQVPASHHCGTLMRFNHPLYATGSHAIYVFGGTIMSRS